MVLTQKTPKKRPAASQGGPHQKKRHVESTVKSSKPKSTVHAGKSVSGPKRSQPITRAVEEEEGSEDEWVSEDSRDELKNDDQTEMEVDQEDKAPKDPNAARESHKAQKVLHDQRRAAKPHSSLMVEAKRLWSLVRRKNIPPAERQQHVKALMDVMRGKVKEIVFKHDASRIVQSVVKYGGQPERDQIAAELKGKFKELSQSKYSKFLVTKLIRFCPSHRSSILLEFQSSVLRMLLHKEASSVLADAFELYANAYERSILLREFYGKEANLFNFTSGSEADKELGKKGLSGVLEGADAERRRRILTAVKENLETIYNNSDKGAVTHAIVHRALWEYLTAVKEVPDEQEQERLAREMFDICQEVLAEMVHTKDGSRVVREFIAQGSAKDRKQILKVLKPHIDRMAVDDEAQLVLFTALDVTDDTKLLAKSVVAPITAAAAKLYASPQGRRSVLYLIVPRTRRHFTPAQIACLSETDITRVKTSKKSPESREEEIRKVASEDLLKWIEDSAHLLAKEPNGCLVLAEVLLHADGDKSKAAQSLLKVISTPLEDSSQLIDIPTTSRLFKTLLQGGHYNHTTSIVEPVPTSMWDSCKFAIDFIEVVGQEEIVTMCVGRGNGTFVVAEMMEALIRCEVEDVTEVRKTVKGWFGKELIEKIEAGETKGKKILLEKLALL
ncbi:armadillo-type protein [Crepidotus variabilis]|uniref:Armadillo-type protein n=1 Tax=Crepidotus variabilis TaxID=179855 RepID=A0A9P6EDV7_9AGAR|nr:armadillo-type protein [Crepidotus variabilis]